MSNWEESPIGQEARYERAVSDLRRPPRSSGPKIERNDSNCICSELRILMDDGVIICKGGNVVVVVNQKVSTSSTGFLMVFLDGIDIPFGICGIIRAFGNLIGMAAAVMLMGSAAVLCREVQPGMKRAFGLREGEHHQAKGCDAMFVSFPHFQSANIAIITLLQLATSKEIDSFVKLMYKTLPHHPVRTDTGDFKGPTVDRKSEPCIEGNRSFSGIAPHEVVPVFYSKFKGIFHRPCATPLASHSWMRCHTTQLDRLFAGQLRVELAVTGNNRQNIQIAVGYRDVARINVFITCETAIV